MNQENKFLGFYFGLKAEKTPPPGPKEFHNNALTASTKVDITVKALVYIPLIHICVVCREVTATALVMMGCLQIMMNMMI